MKLLFDENVSPRLVVNLAAEYPGDVHVRNVGLRGAEDHEIWDYACAEQFAVVSKDSDFRDRSYVQGFPPKIIWLDVSNAGTAAITELLQRERERVERFGDVRRGVGADSLAGEHRGLTGRWSRRRSTSWAQAGIEPPRLIANVRPFRLTRVR